MRLGCIGGVCSNKVELLRICVSDMQLAQQKYAALCQVFRHQHSPCQGSCALTQASTLRMLHFKLQWLVACSLLQLGQTALLSFHS